MHSSHLLVANEGEPNSYGLPDSVDPVGSVSVIALAVTANLKVSDIVESLLVHPALAEALAEAAE